MLVSRLALGSLIIALAQPALAQDVHISNGQVVEFDTGRGFVTLDSLVIEQGGTLRVFGHNRFRLLAKRGIVINGTLDVSGFDAMDVGTLNTGHIPERGAEGGPGAGEGGIGSRNSHTSTDGGTDGVGWGPLFGSRGGGGGESGYQNIAGAGDERRGAGGGGGVLAPDQPVNIFDLSAPENLGLVAEQGMNGASLAFGARTGLPVPQGGEIGEVIFLDAFSDNDFFGRKLLGPSIIVGELNQPLAGRGGGGGGDAIPSVTFPSTPFFPSSDEKGAGGGGGGGLCVLVSPYIAVGPSGHLHADGGNGAAGENTLFFNRVGGGSGGGSGGSLILQARTIDLRNAPDGALSALGGQGGRGRNNVHAVEGAGGNGGPGIIQFHVPNGTTDLLLPPGVSLGELCSPVAHVLLPEAAL